jgi:triacylglycerol esterase/lipase EstA (alpha/beta hydrolase family)
MRARPLVAAAISTAAACAVFAAPALADSTPATGPLPVIYNGFYGYSHASSTASPPGANLGCKPSSAHPYPVVLVHGTFGDMSDSWQALSPLLYDNGYCVYALNYGSYNGSGAFGVYGTGYIEQSASELGSFIQTVLQSTGASQVDIVGHSQGGMMPRYYIKHGGASYVHALIGLAPSNHGTTAGGLFTLAKYFPGASSLLLADCPACQEQEAGSPFITDLNAGGETDPNIQYTVIESRNDEVVTPYTSAFLTPGSNVTNLTLQDQCPLDQGEHLSMPYDHIADTDVLNALDPSQAFPTVCTPVAPVSGG